MVGFYEYAAKKGWYSGDLAAGVVRGLETNVEAGTDVRDLIPQRRNNQDPIRPFSVEDYRTLRGTLGPLPSERTAKDSRPSRDRLIADIATFVGLRVSEVKRLTRHPFQAIVVDSNAAYINIMIEVEGKGSKGKGPKNKTSRISSLAGCGNQRVY